MAGSGKSISDLGEQRDDARAFFEAVSASVEALHAYHVRLAVLGDSQRGGNRTDLDPDLDAGDHTPDLRGADGV
ncbi:hypothetical protein LTR53_020468, partial [Teratosphaeriaceae sp. CCFEE 6253]